MTTKQTVPLNILLFNSGQILDVLLSIMLLTHYFPRCSARVLVHSYIFIFASSLQTCVTIHIPCRTM
jgi:hypothetical protein